MHLSDGEIRGFLDNEITETDGFSIKAHLESCSTCRERGQSGQGEIFLRTPHRNVHVQSRKAEAHRARVGGPRIRGRAHEPRRGPGGDLVSREDGRDHW